MSAKAFAHPVQTLREHVLALEAAITVVLAGPKKEPVHRLRTSTRRIEAQLELLSLLPDLPDHAKPARKVRKLLKKLRRAAGSVRDLDVQRKLVKEQVGAHPSKKLRRDGDDLRRTLKRQRVDEAARLVKLLEIDRQSLAPALEHLLEILRPAENLSLLRSRLAQLTLDWYKGKAPETDANRDSDPDHLHTIRKSAKLARYIAETGAPKTAQSFESLQQAGGAWHDLLTLSEITERQLGARSPLTRMFAEQQTSALEAYRRALGDHQAEVSPV